MTVPAPPSPVAPLERLPNGEPKLFLVFDVDGTLCQVGARADYDNPATFRHHCRPIVEACRRVRELARKGHALGFVTGRRRDFAPVTRAQLEEWLGPDVYALADVEHRPRDVFDWADYVSFKADFLRDHAADLYVGDLAEDRTAAAMAGVPYMHAEHFRQGYDFEHLLPAPDRPGAGADVTLAIAGVAAARDDAGLPPSMESVKSGRRDAIGDDCFAPPPMGAAATASFEVETSRGQGA